MIGKYFLVGKWLININLYAYFEIDYLREILVWYGKWGIFTDLLHRYFGQ